MFNRLKQFFIKNNNKKDEIDDILESIKCLSPENFENVYSSYLSLFTIESLYENLDSYVYQVDYFKKLIELDIEIPNSKIVREKKIIKLKSFFLDNKGCYIDTVNSFSRFKDVLIEFLDVYKQNRNKLDYKSKVNYDRLPFVVTNIKELAEKFHHVN